VLGLIPPNRDDNAIRADDYQILPAPDRKLIWYKLETRLPDLSISNRTGLTLPKPERKSNRMSIQASLLEAPPVDQLVWQPSTKEQLKERVDLPNMAAFRPPPAPEAAPAPPPPPQPPQDPPAPEDPLATRPPKPAPRKFVPPAETRRAGAPARLELSDPGVTLAAGNPAAIGELSGVVAGINPSMKDLPALPEGIRPGSISVGPDATGARNSAGGVPEASGVAGLELITRGAGSAPAVKPVFAAVTVMFSRESLEQRRTAVAVPVRLAMLPPAVKERFGERAVYLVFLDRMNDTHYPSEAMMWFAAREQSAMGGRTMHGPVPFRQKDPFSPKSKVSVALKGQIRLAAVVGADGFVTEIRVIGGPDDQVNQLMADAVGSWTFLPAMRGGERIAVDVLFDIPLALRP
jgi:hypothetical protein